MTSFLNSPTARKGTIMSTTQLETTTTSDESRVAAVSMKFEVTTLPVADVKDQPHA